MDVTLMDAAVWWSCTDCGVEVELPAGDAAGFRLSCPDCPGSLNEMWSWEPAAA